MALFGAVLLSLNELILSYFRSEMNHREDVRIWVVSKQYEIINCQGQVIKRVGSF